jgi:hypothetical protein
VRFTLLNFPAALCRAAIERTDNGAAVAAGAGVVAWDATAGAEVLAVWVSSTGLRVRLARFAEAFGFFIADLLGGMNHRLVI